MEDIGSSVAQTVEKVEHATEAVVHRIGEALDSAAATLGLEGDNQEEGEMAPRKKTVSASAEPIEVDHQEEVEEVVDATGEEEKEEEEEGEEGDEDEDVGEEEYEVEAIIDHKQHGVSLGFNRLLVGHV